MHVLLHRFVLIFSRWIRLCFLLVFVLPSVAFAKGETIHSRLDDKEVTVLASSSLALPLTKIIRNYTRAHSISITASFDASAEQALKITQGGSADIFISSHPFWLNELKQQGLVDVYSITNLVRNRLSVVCSKECPFSVPDKVIHASPVALFEFLRKRTSLIISHPESTALGLYTKAALVNLSPDDHSNLWEKIDRSSIKALSASNALYLIAKGRGAGIIFSSDAYRNDEVKILTELPADPATPVVVQAAVVAGEHMEEARVFLEYLKSPEATRVFSEYGFSTASE